MIVLTEIITEWFSDLIAQRLQARGWEVKHNFTLQDTYSQSDEVLANAELVFLLQGKKVPIEWYVEAQKAEIAILVRSHKQAKG